MKAKRACFPNQKINVVGASSCWRTPEWGLSHSRGISREDCKFPPGSGWVISRTSQHHAFGVPPVGSLSSITNSPWIITKSMPTGF